MSLLTRCKRYIFLFEWYGDHRELHVLTHAFPTRRSSDLAPERPFEGGCAQGEEHQGDGRGQGEGGPGGERAERPAAQQAEREADLAAGRAGQELAERDEIGIAALPDPPAADEIGRAHV